MSINHANQSHRPIAVKSQSRATEDLDVSKSGGVPPDHIKARTAAKNDTVPDGKKHKRSHTVFEFVTLWCSPITKTLNNLQNSFKFAGTYNV